MENNNNRYLIIGGMGFIGKNLAIEILKNGDQVRILDKLDSDVQKKIFRDFHTYSSLYESRIEFISGDFSDKKILKNAMSETDYCIHLGTTTNPKTANDNKVYDIETNLIGAISILSTALESSVKRTIFLSSGGTVYGNPLFSPITEEHPTAPLTSYGIVKLAIENYCSLYKHLYGLNTTVLRLSNPYGPGQQTNTMQGAISVFLRKALNNEPIEIWGNGSAVRDYIYIDDVIRAILSTLNYSGKETVFNIGSGMGTDLNAIVNILKTVLKKDISVSYLPERRIDVSVNILDISKAERLLSWSPQVPIVKGVERLIKYMNHKYL